MEREQTVGRLLQQVVEGRASSILADDEHLVDAIDRRQSVEDATGAQLVRQHKLGADVAGSPRDLI